MNSTEPTMAAKVVGTLAYAFDDIQPMLPSYLLLIASAVFPIYTAAHSSLFRPSSAAKSKRKSTATGEDEDYEEDRVQMEGMGASDALLFPLFAGITLAGLYYLIQWLKDPEMLNKILNWYFAIVGLYGVCKFVSDALHFTHNLVFPNYYRFWKTIWHVDQNTRKVYPMIRDADTAKEKTTPLPGLLSLVPAPAFISSACWSLRSIPSKKLTIQFYVRRVVAIKSHVDAYNALAIVLGLGSVLWFNLVSKPWFLTNLMGFAFSYSALQIMSPTSFGIGTLVLVGLFFYDIYMVFYTPMMVTVAQALDIPIKLMFPRPSLPDDPNGKQFMALGLGDIVLPGIVMGLALRFDIYMHYLRKQRTTPAPTSTDPAAVEVVKARYVSPARHWADHLWILASLAGAGAVPIDTGHFKKTYFHASVVGYVLGLIITLGVMQFAKHPQPALLYLVPGVLGSIWLTALIRREVKLVWEFSEEAEQDDITPANLTGKVEGSESDEKNAEIGAAEIEKRAEFKKLPGPTKGFFSSLLFSDEHDTKAAAPSESKMQAADEQDTEADKVVDFLRSDRTKPLLAFSLSIDGPKTHSSSNVDGKEHDPKWVASAPRDQTVSEGEPAGKRLRTA